MALNSEIIREYRRFRAEGENAKSALYCARAVVEFSTLDGETVRICAEYEQENYFDVYGEPDTEKEKAEIIRSLELYGCWYVFAQVRCPHCGAWFTVDGVGMCIENRPCDPHNNPYVPDLMRAALDKAKGYFVACCA